MIECMRKITLIYEKNGKCMNRMESIYYKLSYYKAKWANNFGE